MIISGSEITNHKTIGHRLPNGTKVTAPGHKGVGTIFAGTVAPQPGDAERLTGDLNDPILYGVLWPDGRFTWLKGLETTIVNEGG